MATLGQRPIISLSSHADDTSCQVNHPPVNPQPVATVPSHRQHEPRSRQLRDWTTFGIGGEATTWCVSDDEDALIDAILSADEKGHEVLVLGGGSNMVVSDAEFDGVVVRNTRREIEVVHDTSCGGVVIRAAAGVSWDDLVAASIEGEWLGFEALSGIPGTVGAAPVQNIGAYGHEVSEVLSSVRVWDRLERRRRTLAYADLALGYRTSLLKQSLTDPSIGGGRAWGLSPRWIVLEVEFHTRRSTLSAPVLYRELANRLGVEVGQRVDARAVRDAVLDLRRGKHMVLDDEERDTYSAGSFFTNPILTAEQARLLPEDAPRFPVGDDQVKTSAAWLIDHAGFAPGFHLDDDSSVTLSTVHALALTNRGGARTESVVRLARAVRDGVHRRFGVELHPEPVCIGVTV